jgi:hypothetical protein
VVFELPQFLTKLSNPRSGFLVSLFLLLDLLMGGTQGISSSY